MRAVSLAQVYAFTNGMVMAFDRHGQQIPELQGRIEEAKPGIREHCEPETEFWTARWQTWRQQMDREIWMGLTSDKLAAIAAEIHGAFAR